MEQWETSEHIAATQSAATTGLYKSMQNYRRLRPFLQTETFVKLMRALVTQVCMMPKQPCDLSALGPHHTAKAVLS